jgi:MFS family permease
VSVIRGVSRGAAARLAIPFSVPAAGSPQRNLAADVSVAVGMGLTTALVGMLLPAIARRGGMDAVGLAMLTAAPFAAMVLSVLAGRIGPRTARGLALLRAGGSLLLVVLLLDASTPAMSLVVLAFWATITFGLPFHTRLWGQLYPEHRRGRMVGIVGTGRAAAAGIGVLAGGLLADQVGGLPVVAAAGVLGIGFGASAMAIRVADPTPPDAYSARGSLRALRSSPLLLRALLGQGLLGGGVIAAGPLLAIVQVDRLALSLADIAMLGVVTSTATTVSFVAFGGLVDRRGGMASLRLGGAFGVGALLLYAVAPSAAMLWMAAAAMGLSSAGVEMGIQGVLAEHTSLEDRSAATAGWSAVMGLRGMVAPFVLTMLLALGIVGVTGALLLAATVSILGVAVFVRTPSRRRVVSDGTLRALAVASEPVEERTTAARPRVALDAVARWPRRAARSARAVSRRLAHA